MKHIKVFEQFINEARAIPVTLEPGDFEKDSSIWGNFYKKLILNKILKWSHQDSYN